MKNLGKNIFLDYCWSIDFSLLDGYSFGSSNEQLNYSDFKQEVQSKKVKSIVYKGDQMTVEAERFNGTTFTVILPAYVTDQDLNEQLKESDVAIAYEAVEKPSIWSQLLIGAFPLLLYWVFSSYL